MEKIKKCVSDNAQLLQEWNWEKNDELGLNPQKLTCGSDKKVWWICSQCKHRWMDTISHRNQGRTCPVCNKKNFASKYRMTMVSKSGSLAEKYPEIAAQWHPTKNGFETPNDFPSTSATKVWWMCGEGHEWQATIGGRKRGRGCPYCSGYYPIQGENDLQTINPILAKEWNYEKNNGLTPVDVLSNSGKKVWWMCSKGHEWKAVIQNRNKGNGCPICNSERNTSFVEYALVYYLKKYGLDIIHSYKEKGYELDVYIPSEKIAIEYDGYYWHKDKVEKDLEKNSKCKKDGIKLYRIREGLLPLNGSSIDYVVQESLKDLSQVLEDVLGEILGISIDVDLKRDAIAIENLREYTEKEISLLFSNPTLAKEWNYEKNGNLKPENFAANSGKKTWWKCNNGHEWQATIASRNSGNGCPYCSGYYPIKGENDLQTINPTLAKEWNYEKNNALTPMDVLPNSNKKVWWKCDKGHEWKSTIGGRNIGNGCPYCAGQKVLKGYNDLQTINPTLAKEWNYERNNELAPAGVLPNSDKKVWWKCDNGHEWQATIGNRNRGHGCPYCASQKVLKSYNDLQTVNPTLAKEWNYEKNNGLTPTDVLPNSNKKVWWKCNKGHEWQATIASRNNGRGCSYCSSRYVVKGESDLQTVNPMLAKEWHYEKNNELTPMDVLSNSHKKVWWRCNKGHEWQATVINRSKGRGCPYCSSKKILIGYNDLQAVNPILAKEWNYVKNNGLTPMDVMPSSHKKVWWKCGKGHEWQASIDSRNRGNGCSQCANERRKKSI